MTEAGELLTEGQARQIIIDVVQRLNALDLGLKSLIKQVRKAQSHCLAYLREISYQTGAIG